jgi:monolysocardiolipin acyltransferase
MWPSSFPSLPLTEKLQENQQNEEINIGMKYDAIPKEMMRFENSENEFFADAERSFIFSAIVSASKMFMNIFNDVVVYRKQILDDAILNREKNRPLVTVANHNACLDDPALISTISPISVLKDSRAIRWGLCASDVCFKNPSMIRFFSATKALPAYRGSGLHQASIDFVIEKLKQGKWLHIFPEGAVIQNKGYAIARCKWGVGKALASVRNLNPLLVPFVHRGMENVNPLPGRYDLKTGKKVRVLVGDPVPLDDLFNSYESLVENKYVEF